ncbi:MAG: hypothetical protein HY074_04660 [Deltaproteobacteria bacterium]|nr:hypothetical protein [Deltaproteobacteria bacterium]
MNCATMRVLFALFCLLPMTAQAVPRPSVFNGAVWYDGSKDAALPAALGRGLVRYHFISDVDVPTAELAFDFETALYSWLQSLDLPNVRLAATAESADADIVIHYGPKPYLELPEGMRGHSAHHYRDAYGMRQDKIISVIEVKPAATNGDEYPWTSIREARAQDGITLSLIDGKKTKVTLTEIFSSSRSPDQVAHHLVATQPNIDLGEFVYAGNGYKRVLYWTFLHELGHAFGLADLYSYPGNEYDEPDFSSVMRSVKWPLLVPSPADLVHVSGHIKESGLCERLLRSKLP